MRFCSAADGRDAVRSALAKDERAGLVVVPPHGVTARDLEPDGAFGQVDSRQRRCGFAGDVEPARQNDFNADRDECRAG
ncbi:hypothetical protein IFM12276_61010 [Nocardia sputorum]|uniref:Uncharacterized protein n=1 Tax=Nocardia sputorum TaxID=2984338 RepID=A0ABN6UCR1_9NOCA|nr:hypothetical protein IFM12276_61010 [Nocardia sputorum]